MDAPPEAMRLLLERLDARHGSTRDYLRACGVASATLAMLADALLEPAPGR